MQNAKRDFLTVKGPRIPNGQIHARRSPLTLSLPWPYGSKEGSRERSAESASSYQDSRHQGKGNHLDLLLNWESGRRRNWRLHLLTLLFQPSSPFPGACCLPLPLSPSRPWPIITLQLLGREPLWLSANCLFLETHPHDL